MIVPTLSHGGLGLRGGGGTEFTWTGELNINVLRKMSVTINYCLVTTASCQFEKFLQDLQGSRLIRQLFIIRLVLFFFLDL